MTFLRKKYPEKKFDPPKKHFIFGDLVYNTDNAEENGMAEWYNHVALAIKISDSDDLYILDPSLRETPLPKAEYHRFLTESGSTLRGFVTCVADTYSKRDNCFDPVASPYVEADLIQETTTGLLDL